MSDQNEDPRGTGERREDGAIERRLRGVESQLDALVPLVSERFWALERRQRPEGYQRLTDPPRKPDDAAGDAPVGSARRTARLLVDALVYDPLAEGTRTQHLARGVAARCGLRLADPPGSVTEEVPEATEETAGDSDEARLDRLYRRNRTLNGALREAAEVLREVGMPEGLSVADDIRVLAKERDEAAERVSALVAQVNAVTEERDRLVAGWEETSSVWQGRALAGEKRLLERQREAPEPTEAELRERGERELAGGSWCVTVVGSRFGSWLDAGLPSGVIVMIRDGAGWRVPASFRHTCLSHQVYVDRVTLAASEVVHMHLYEVAVVNPWAGLARTVWLREGEEALAEKHAAATISDAPEPSGGGEARPGWRERLAQRLEDTAGSQGAVLTAQDLLQAAHTLRDEARRLRSFPPAGECKECDTWQEKLHEQISEGDEEAGRIRAAFGIVPDGRSLEAQLLEVAAVRPAGEGEPVMWRWRRRQLSGEWGTWVPESFCPTFGTRGDWECEVQPLYASPQPEHAAPREEPEDLVEEDLDRAFAPPPLEEEPVRSAPRKDP